MATKAQMKKAAAGKPAKKTKGKAGEEEKVSKKKDKIVLGSDASIDDIQQKIIAIVAARLGIA